MGELKKSLSGNIGGWILATLLALSMFSQYRTGGKLSRVCESFIAMQEEHPLAWLELLAENRPAHKIQKTCSDYLASDPYER